MLRLSDFDFDLPEELIARFPPETREGGRLLLLDRASGRIEHRRFVDLPGILRPGDLLVLNDSKVLPARLTARKAGTGGRVDVLLVEPASDDSRVWRAMVTGSKSLRPGAAIEIGGSGARVAANEGDGFVLLELGEDGESLARRAGEMPIPPYLGREPEAIDRERYQTIFARQDAQRSVAAPTAGLHFSPAVFEALAQRGVRRAAVTLHVGPGTFLPVRAENLEEHRMHAERYEVSAGAAHAIGSVEESGGRVVAAGTTVVRVLESLGATVAPGSATTSLFIRPPFGFCRTGAMLTNFHLPRSTLLMLVSAFAGREPILEAYREAVRERYRFFSYGDAMVIL